MDDDVESAHVCATRQRRSDAVLNRRECMIGAVSVLVKVWEGGLGSSRCWSVTAGGKLLARRIARRLANTLGAWVG